MTKINTHSILLLFDSYLYFDTWIGFQFEKFEIHGRVGLITHAIHHHLPVNGNTSSYQMIEYVPSLSVLFFIYFNFFACMSK
jgi:hypothetical protein